MHRYIIRVCQINDELIRLLCTERTIEQRLPGGCILLDDAIDAPAINPEKQVGAAF